MAVVIYLYELHYLERGEQLAERKSIYEELYPETKNGMRNGQTAKKMPSIILETPSFADDTGSKTGLSPRTIRQDIQLARDLVTDIPLEQFLNKFSRMLLAKRKNRLTLL